MIVGVDIGGTFTDFVVQDRHGLHIHKQLSSPHAPAEAMLAGLHTVTAGALGRLERVAHGSTIATNAILERKGARAALIATAGFRDLLLIGRQHRPDLYALRPTLPSPLIPREYCYDLPERLDHTGAVLTPIDFSALDSILDAIVVQSVDAIAVCLLYSYRNPAHEHAVRAHIVERGLFPADRVVLSSDVLHQFREVERASATALETYLRPPVDRYLGSLEAALPYPASLRVMQSDGGIVSTRRARDRAIGMALSGPAAGVIGAFATAQAAGFDRILTLDIGGTSTDVAVCPGSIVQRADAEIDGLALPIRLIDIETIGAGGGSIAQVDRGGLLRVGPESAGASPGPAAYGRGGLLATVTDANLALGRLSPDQFLGGGMRLNGDAAQSVLQALGEGMAMSAKAAARGVIRIANANIDRALRRVSIARSHDPRDFTLVAFGGAGPLHACEVAEALEIPRVLIPRHPGVLCAYGLLMADISIEHTHAIMRLLDERAAAPLFSALSGLMAAAHADFAREGVTDSQRKTIAAIDARYVGQAYELPIPYTPAQNMDDLADHFHQAHQRAYGYTLPGRAIELINLRVQAIGITEKPPMTPEPLQSTIAPSMGAARILTADGEADAHLYERDDLYPGAMIDGAAVIFQLDCTTYLPPDWRARVDGYRNLIAARA